MYAFGVTLRAGKQSSNSALPRCFDARSLRQAALYSQSRHDLILVRALVKSKSRSHHPPYASYASKTRTALYIHGMSIQRAGAPSEPTSFNGKQARV